MHAVDLGLLVVNPPQLVDDLYRAVAVSLSPTRLSIRDLPVHLDWSPTDRTVGLADRRQRVRAYEIVLPKRIKAARQPLVDAVRASRD